MTLTDIDLETVRTDELQFKKDKYSGDYSKKSFTIIEGKNPLIISSVHSVKTTEKIMSSRDITKAIEMAKVDEDNVLEKIITREIITDPKDIEIDPIKINGEKKQISDIADDFKLNPYVLRYYFCFIMIKQLRFDTLFYYY